MGVCHAFKNTKILNSITIEEKKQNGEEHSLQPMESKKNLDEIYDDELNFESKR